MRAATTLLALGVLAAAQNVTVPSDCVAGFYPGVDTVVITIPYTYQQSMSIIGSYKNLTWSGNPDNTVTLNGTDNTVGTARTYDTAGAHVIETILSYSKPPNGPYYENHNLALLTVPSLNVSLYAQIDETTVTPVCNGKASQFNLTAVYCATNATVAGGIFHQLHSMDILTVGQFLGGQNFTTCDAISATTTSTGPMATFTGAADRRTVGRSVVGMMAAALVALTL